MSVAALLAAMCPFPAPLAALPVAPSEPSEPALWAPEPARDPLPALQGTQRGWEPKWYVAVGGYYVNSDLDFTDELPLAPEEPDPEQGAGLSLHVGTYNWREEMGLGLEGGLMTDTYSVDDPGGLGGTDDVRVLRGLIGLRIADRGSIGNSWIPYLRGGFMYRRDEGDVVKTDGYGWYLGGGVDLRLGNALTIGPHVMYSETTALNAQEWIAGVVLTFAF